MYIDHIDENGNESRFCLNAQAADKLKTARTINGIKFDGTANVHNYGVCSTAAATAAKTVTVGGTFVLATGAQVTVKFTNANSASSPTLNVNGTGAKPIYRYATTTVGTSTTTSGWRAGSLFILTYDGTGWVREYWANTTYSAATTDTAGLMSAADKTKLNGITESADAVSYSQTQTAGTEIGTITINGTATTIYAPSYSNMTGATAEAAGAAGFVPAPAAGKQSSFLRGDGTWAVPTDNKVKQSLTTANAAFPILLAPNGQTATTTTSSYFDSGVTLNPSTNTIAANISGNAATATKLATARTITLTGSVTGSGSFDGSGNLSIATTTNHTHSVTYKKSATATAAATQGGTVGKTTITPAGTISAPTFTASPHNHTFTGSEHNHTLTPTTQAIYSITGLGQMFSATVSGEVLVLTAGTAPTRSEVSVMTSVSIAKATQGGTIGNKTVTGTVSAPTFSGTEMEHTHTFTGASHSHSITLTDTAVTAT